MDRDMETYIMYCDELAYPKGQLADMGDYSFRVEARSEGDASTDIRLFGTISSCNVGELLIQLSAIFDRTDKVTIDLSEVRNIDIYGLKLFCSCRRSLLFSGKELRITGLDNPAIRTTILSEGYQRTSGCAFNAHHNCIWSGGT